LRSTCGHSLTELPSLEGRGWGWVGERSEPSYAHATRHRIDPELTRRARELHNNPTPAELAVWRRIARYRPAFTRQLVVPPFIIDPACRRAKLGIEFDGSHHATQIEADARRTAFLEGKGGGSFGCGMATCSAIPMAPSCILAEAAECLGGTHPQPLPSREGRSRASRQR
jgi:very-short-patch-repair endonuclease